jgi:hypothetical protein
MTFHGPGHMPVQLLDCDFCIDGLRPSRVDQLLGPLFQACLGCTNPCKDCGGDSVFPAAPSNLPLFVAVCGAQGWAPVLCSACMGVDYLIEIKP